MDKAFAWLTGRFDSSEQAAANPTYFAIQLETCPVAAPGLGERVLYVEQARMDLLDSPYRQRLYVVEAGEGPEVISRVFELATPASWIGACGESEPRGVTPDDVTERAGCAVHLTRSGLDGFVGGTQGTECESSLNGASYATSEVSLSAADLESWDRGFDADGAQVWGATAGPYRFIRQ